MLGSDLLLDTLSETLDAHYVTAPIAAPMRSIQLEKCISAPLFGKASAITRQDANVLSQVTGLVDAEQHVEAGHLKLLGLDPGDSAAQ